MSYFLDNSQNTSKISIHLQDAINSVYIWYYDTSLMPPDVSAL